MFNRRTFLSLSLLLILVSMYVLLWEESETEKFSVSTAQAEWIGRMIWKNEGAGKVANLSVWNRNEEFPSFGIGHFIWYPVGVEAPFSESFPSLMKYIRQHHAIPKWMEGIKDAPWNSREAFYEAFESSELIEMREWLVDTIPLQTQFIVQRMQASLPKMLAGLDSDQQEMIERRFYRVAKEPQGLYALIDYVNFKGEGVAITERYQNQGWGLLQVLQVMEDGPDTMQAFADAADKILTLRVANAPRDESGWLPGWRKRLQTYLLIPPIS